MLHKKFKFKLNFLEDTMLVQTKPPPIMLQLQRGRIVQRRKHPQQRLVKMLINSKGQGPKRQAIITLQRVSIFLRHTDFSSYVTLHFTI